MFRTIDDVRRQWHAQSAGTLAVLEALTDESLATEIAPGHRTLGRIAWHLAVTIPEMMGKVGLRPRGPAEDAPVPATAAEIAAAYREASDSLLDEISSRWTDGTLLEEDEMYGERWARGFTVLAFLQHEVHHRGQITALMRRAGLRVPGLLGPAKEDWATFGMDAPAL